MPPKNIGGHLGSAYPYVMGKEKGWRIFAIGVWIVAVGVGLALGSVPAAVAIFAVGALVARSALFLPPLRRLKRR
jgi:hypothetical protein